MNAQVFWEVIASYNTIHHSVAKRVYDFNSRRIYFSVIPKGSMVS